MEKFYRIYIDQYRREKELQMKTDIINNFAPKIKDDDLHIANGVIMLSKDCGVTEKEINDFVNENNIKINSK